MSGGIMELGSSRAKAFWLGLVVSLVSALLGVYNFELAFTTFRAHQTQLHPLLFVQLALAIDGIALFITARQYAKKEMSLLAVLICLIATGQLLCVIMPISAWAAPVLIALATMLGGGFWVVCTAVCCTEFIVRKAVLGR